MWWLSSKPRILALYPVSGSHAGSSWGVGPSQLAILCKGAGVPKKNQRWIGGLGQEFRVDNKELSTRLGESGHSLSLTRFLAQHSSPGWIHKGPVWSPGTRVAEWGGGRTLTLRSLRSRAARGPVLGSARVGLPGGVGRRLCWGRRPSPAGSGAAGRARGWRAAWGTAAPGVDLPAGNGAGTSQQT